MKKIDAILESYGKEKFEQKFEIEIDGELYNGWYIYGLDTKEELQKACEAARKANELNKYKACKALLAVLSKKWDIKNEKGEIICKIQPDIRIKYLKDLKGNTSALAEEYIRKTPVQIKTKYRAQIEEELNWKSFQ